MSTWDREDDRLLLLELVTTGRTVTRRGQDAARRHLAELRWIRQTSRPGWEVEPASRDRLEQLLAKTWPEWREVHARLAAAGLPPTSTGIAELRDRARMARVGELPPMLHTKTFAAAVGLHSKVGPARRRTTEDGPQLTTDQVLRLRPSPGLVLRQGATELDAEELATVNGGEIVLTQRALLSGTTLAGAPPKALLFVENLGAYLDLQRPEGWLVVHVPGWDSSLIRELRPPPAVPVLHFGDLDPEGVRITAHLRALFPSLKWFVPAFAADYFADHAQRCDWPDLPPDLPLPPTVEELRRTGRWLEQEVLVLDRRCREELEALATGDAR